MAVLAVLSPCDKALVAEEWVRSKADSPLAMAKMTSDEYSTYVIIYLRSG